MNLDAKIHIQRILNNFVTFLIYAVQKNLCLAR